MVEDMPNCICPCCSCSCRYMGVCTSDPNSELGPYKDYDGYIRWNSEWCHGKILDNYHTSYLDCVDELFSQLDDWSAEYDIAQLEWYRNIMSRKTWLDCYDKFMEYKDSREAITDQIHQIAKQFRAAIGSEEAEKEADKENLEEGADKNTLKQKQINKKLKKKQG